MKSRALARAATAVAALLVLSPAVAEDLTLGGGGITLSGGVGIIGLEGREYVFAGTGSTNVLSLLVWQSVAPVLTTGLEVTLPDGWTIAGKAQVAMGGDSYMEDYDWINTAPGFTNYEFDNWTHRSQHPDTNLDWYFNGSIALGFDIAVDDEVTVNLNGGFKYSDVQWAAVGGSFVYSTLADGYRGDVGTFPNEPGITYRQQFPALFLGMDYEVTQDQWTFGLSAQGGLTFQAVARDNHWMRDPAPLGLLFVDTLQIAPTAALSASAEYAATDHLHVFLGGTLDKVFLARGDIDQYDNNTGVLMGTFPDAAGAELLAASVSAGVKGSF